MHDKGFASRLLSHFFLRQKNSKSSRRARKSFRLLVVATFHDWREAIFGALLKEVFSAVVPFNSSTLDSPIITSHRSAQIYRIIHYINPHVSAAQQATSQVSMHEITFANYLNFNAEPIRLWGFAQLSEGFQTARKLSNLRLKERINAARIILFALSKHHAAQQQLVPVSDRLIQKKIKSVSHRLKRSLKVM